MTSATQKPRAGEHTKAVALHELIADYRHLAWPEDDGTVEAMRLNLIERALREHSSKTKVLEAERDSLREREKALIDVLGKLLDVTKRANIEVPMSDAPVFFAARDLLAKHGR